MTRKPIALACALFSSQLLAFPCFMTVAKDNCWIDYDVTVVVLDAMTNSTLVTVDVPKGTPWTRVPFTCQPAQRLAYTATFSPTIWEKDKGRVYPGTKYTLLPLAPGPTEKGWEIPICFPAAFPGTSLPPTAIGNCQCNMAVIPPVPPIK